MSCALYIFLTTYFSLLFISASNDLFTFNEDVCQEKVKQSQKILAQLALHLSEVEEQRRHNAWKSFWHETNRLEQLQKFQPLKLGYFKASSNTKDSKNDTDSERCPKPHSTVFPTLDPDSLKTNLKDRHESENIFVQTLREDQTFSHFHTNYVHYLQHSLLDPASVCNGPPLESLNSVTRHQFHGFLAQSSILWAKPLCPVCKVIVGEMKDMANALLLELDKHDEQHILNLTSSILPSTSTICKAMLPACYRRNKRDEEQETDALSENSTNCLKCSVCMSSTKILMHKLFLEEEAMGVFYEFLNNSIFYNLCAELCIAFPPGSSSIFPDGVSFDKEVLLLSQFSPNVLHDAQMSRNEEKDLLCMNFMNDTYDRAVPVLPHLLMPQYFCKDVE